MFLASPMSVVIRMAGHYCHGLHGLFKWCI